MVWKDKLIETRFEAYRGKLRLRTFGEREERILSAQKVERFLFFRLTYARI